MKVFSMLIFFLFLLSLLFQSSHCTTIVVDGVSEWPNPTVHVGDSIIFEHKYHYSLYIFQNQRAFNLCNFTQATLLNKPNSTSFTWHPSRLGFFYFSFNNGTLKPCEEGQKLAIEVSPAPIENVGLSPEVPPMTAPVPASGGVVASSPADSWPFRPHELKSPSSAPSASPPVSLPPLVPNKGGIPFINSNPAVPLPTGEVDSATIRPLPTSDHARQVVGLLAPLCFVVCLLLL